MATTKATELGQLGSKLTVHNEDITLDGNVHGQYAGFDSDFTVSITAADTGDLSEGSNLYYTDVRADARAQLKINALVDAAPGSLDTLNELAAALGDDANFSTTITNSIATKLPLAGGTLTGDLILSEGSPTITLTDTDGNTSSHIKTVGSNMELHAQHGNMRFRVGSSGLEYMRIAPGGDISFYEDTGTTAKFFWDASAERLGLGTSSPVAPISVLGPISNTLQATISGGSGGTSRGLHISTATTGQSSNDIVIFDCPISTGTLSFNTNSTERLRITSSGNVGIGTTNPTAKLHVEGTFQVRSSSTSIFNDTNNAENVRMLVSGTHFNADGADKDFRVESNNNTHALFVDGGNDRVCIGHSSTGLFTTSARFEVDATSNSRTAGITTKSSALCLGLWRTTDGQMIGFAHGTNGDGVGGVDATSSGVTYNTTSDRRLKDNIEPIADGTEKLLAMNPVTHTWKADSNTGETVHGFIAQEMQEVVPEAVSGDAESDEMMSMDYGRITPVIVAALQDALKEIEELKTRINKLENN